MENGSIIKCILEGFIPGKMEDLTKGSIDLTKKKGLEFIFGLMEGGMKAIGKMGNNMEKGCIFYRME